VVRLSLLSDVATIAEVAKAAVKFGYRSVIEKDPERSSFDHAVLSRADEDLLSHDLVRLVYLQALAANQPINEVLAQIRAGLEKLGAPLDRRLADAPGIGDGRLED